MAHKKGVGSSRNGRDSNSQRLGVKRFDGELVQPGTIICRQRGSHFHAGRNVRLGRDYTAYSITDGKVKFEFVTKARKRISVLPVAEYDALIAPKNGNGAHAEAATA